MSGGAGASDGAGGADGAALDAPYGYNREAYEKLSDAAPWRADPRWFSRTKVSALAALKMLMHSMEGVRKGKAKPNGLPIEIMGLLFGHLDEHDPHTLVVTDSVPLPVEGVETTVVANTPEVMKFQIDTVGMMEKSRNETLLGWYHSHPFDVGVHSNCFFSQTDVNNQHMFQQMCDSRYGAVGIVCDPLRSKAKGRPEFGAFRSFPPAFDAGEAHTPDGEPLPDKKARDLRWGPAYRGYYQLDIDYFMSSLGSSMFNILSRSFLWTTVFGTTPMLEDDTRDAMLSRMDQVGKKLREARVERPPARAMAARGDGAAEPDALSAGVDMAADLSVEELRGQTMQAIKSAIFSGTGFGAEGAEAEGGAGGRK